MKSRLITAIRLTEIDEWDKAWQELDKLSPAEQHHPSVLELRIAILQALECCDAALHLAQELIAEGCHAPAVYALGAMAAQELESPAAGLQFLLQAGAWAASDPFFLYVRAILEVATYDLDSAKKHLDQAFKQDPRLRQEAAEQDEFESLWPWLREGFGDSEYGGSRSQG
jgi:uncharacterized protein HemY